MKKIFLLILFYFSVTIVFSQISLLDSLTINNKEYNNLNEALLNPEKVIVLNLRRSKLTKFPSEIFLFKNLQFLDLSKNKILKYVTFIKSLESCAIFSSICELYFLCFLYLIYLVNTNFYSRIWVNILVGCEFIP